MPIYEYECDKCGRIEEALQRFSDMPLTTCKNCSGKLHKLISQSAFHLKGTGWYVTDYSGKTNKTSKKSDEKSDQTSNTADTTPANNTKSAGDD
jgi:putative FmdB family regulatory protein